MDKCRNNILNMDLRRQTIQPLINILIFQVHIFSDNRKNLNIKILKFQSIHTKISILNCLKATAKIFLIKRKPQILFKILVVFIKNIMFQALNNKI
jgi:hypothetical protein